MNNDPKPKKEKPVKPIREPKKHPNNDAPIEEPAETKTPKEHCQTIPTDPEPKKPVTPY